MVTKNVSFIKSVDWVIIALYLVLVICGWFSICGASYTYGEPDFLSFDTRAGKQLIWIGCSLAIGFVLLMLEKKLYEMLAYVFYALIAKIKTAFNKRRWKRLLSLCCLSFRK